MKRRHVVLGALAAASLRTAFAALPETVQAVGRPDEILVGGPAGGRMDRWSKATALGMESGLAGLSHDAIDPVIIRTSGGVDGVTAANRLQALVVPDGRTAVMLPGLAAIAYLVADPRVHFQIGNWVPVLAGISSGVLMVRGGAARLGTPEPLRLAASSPESADLAGLLLLARLGVPMAPVFGLRGEDVKAHAFATGEADAVLVTGENVPATTALLTAEGAAPVCSLGAVDESGRIMRDPAFPNLPEVSELAAMRGADFLSPALDAAFRAAAAAALLDFVLVLPHLTAPAAIALWREVGAGAITTPAMESAAYASSIRLGAGPTAEAALAPLALGADALLALQSWLAAHFNWHPA